MIRINKFLAESGIGSRRQNEQNIRNGFVTINGRVATLGEFMDPRNDEVKVHGRLVKISHNLIYIALNKPVGVISSVRDEKGRKTVLDLVKVNQRIYPIGRLDFNSSGLILLTNDGDLVLKLTHPRYHLPKKYIVEVKENVQQEQLEKLEKGVRLEGKTTLPTEVKRISKNKFEIVLYQGLKRQIREMCKALGLNVVTLHRTDIGPLNIGTLKLGEFRYLTNKEIATLKKA